MSDELICKNVAHKMILIFLEYFYSGGDIPGNAQEVTTGFVRLTIRDVWD